MNALARALSGLAAVLDARHRRWALVGGLAVSCHVDPRFTRDVDVAVVVENDADAEALIHSLSAEGYVVSTAVEQDAAARLATVRMISAAQADDVPLDLMFASSGIEPEVCAAAARLEALPGLTVPVATRAHLIALKILSVDERRLQDAIDVRALLAAATTGDLEETRAALETITARGYHRGRDLQRLLEAYVGTN